VLHLSRHLVLLLFVLFVLSRCSVLSLEARRLERQADRRQKVAGRLEEALIDKDKRETLVGRFVMTSTQ
jgi:hypothetical protein